MNHVQLLKNLTTRKKKTERIVVIFSQEYCLNLYGFPPANQTSIIHHQLPAFLTNHGPVRFLNSSIRIDEHAPRIALYHPAYLIYRNIMEVYDMEDAVMLKLIGLPDYKIEIHQGKVEQPYWEKYCKRPSKTLPCGLHKRHHKV